MSERRAFRRFKKAIKWLREIFSVAKQADDDFEILDRLQKEKREKEQRK